MSLNGLFYLLEAWVVAAPLLLVSVLGLASLFGWPFSETKTSRMTQFTVLTGLAAAFTILSVMLVTGDRDVPIEIGDWVVVPGVDHFHFTLKFVFDRLSVPFVLLSYVLVGTVGAFANVYLHREEGYNRFFLLYAIFLCGMVISSLAGTIETLFAGWELVGLSSALLVAYFHERPSPVRNGVRVWTVYRIADAAFLVAAVALHHATGEGDFGRLMGSGAWPHVEASLAPGQALFIGLLLLLAAAGKSALVPFSGWLPRAMEGPTPSSAVFYGSLSVHLGAFLLLRVSPLIALSTPLAATVVVLGLTTAIYGAVAARAQTDIKTALAFASMTQVGIIVAEIGLGLQYIALVHIIGHACLRTLQLLRAPSLLRDYRALENAIGDQLPRLRGFWDKLLTDRQYAWVYRFAHERGYLDGLLGEYVVHPFRRVFLRCDALERRIAQWIAGDARAELDRVQPNPGLTDDVLL